MRVLTLLLALVTFPASSWAMPIAIGGVGVGGSRAIEYVCSARIPDCSLTNISTTNFNAQTPGQLAAAYDVLFFGYDAESSVNADWFSRLSPYMAAGGSVIFESPLNVNDLQLLVTGQTAGVNPSGNLLVTAVPILTTGLGSTVVVNSHIQFTAWGSALSVFLRQTGAGEVVGLYGSVGAGRIVLTGPDNGYHGIDGSPGTAEDNMLELLVNEVNWVPEPGVGASLFAGALALVALSRGRRSQR